MSVLESLSEKHQALLWIAAWKEGEKAARLLEYLGDPGGEKLRAPLQTLLQNPKDKIEEEATRELKRLGSEGRESLFAHAEGGWFLEYFKGESPLVFYVLMRDLPKAKAGRVLKDLSKEMRRSLKSLKEVQIPEPLLQWIRNDCANRFPSVSLDQIQNLGAFGKLGTLSSEQLIRLMKEVGLHEMAIAFCKVNRSATRAILHRLSTEDAKELRNRIKKGGDFSLELQREAQLNILDLDIEKMNAEGLVVEIGFSVFSKAFTKESQTIAPLFIYKLTPRQGYILKRYIDQNIATGSPEKAQKVQERVLDALLRIQKNSEE